MTRACIYENADKERETDSIKRKKERNGEKKTVEKSDEALTRLRGIFVIDKRLTVREKQKREGKHVSSGSVHNTQTTVPTIMYTERNQPPSQL